MSRSSDRGVLRSVRIEANLGLRGIELTLFDSRLREVTSGRGLNHLVATLSPGRYLVRVQAGNASHDQPINVVAGDGVQTISVQAPEFGSPLPISGTVAGRQMSVATAFGKLPSCRREPLGKGGQFFLLGWDGGSGDGRKPAAANPLHGVTLIDLMGTSHPLGSLAHCEATPNGTTYAYVGCDLNPGLYYLHLDSQHGPAIAQTIMVSPGWSTLLVASASYDAPAQWTDGRRLDLPNSSILMFEEGGFHKFTLSDFHLTELARIGLARGRKVMTDEDLFSGMLDGKFHNPMLGLYGAYQFLLEPQPDMALLKKVVINLERLFKEQHPDVLALRLRILGYPKTGKPILFDHPPMLRRSWATLLELSAEHEDLLPADSPAALVANALLPSGECLVWRAPALDEMLRSIKGEGIPDLPLLSHPEPFAMMVLRMKPRPQIFASAVGDFDAPNPFVLPDIAPQPEALPDLLTQILEHWGKLTRGGSDMTAGARFAEVLSNDQFALLEALRELRSVPGVATFDRKVITGLVRRLGKPLSSLHELARRLCNRLALATGR